MTKIPIYDRLCPIDEKLKHNLMLIKRILKKDNDWLMCVLGYEGSGKSTLAILMALFVDPEFNVSRIVFTPEEFMAAVHDAKPYQAIVVDEGANVFFSRTAMRAESVDVTKLLAQIRFKRLFIVLTMPNYNMLERYVRTHRIKTIAKISKRGMYYFYSPKRVRMVKKGVDGKVEFPSPNFLGAWEEYNGELWEEYLKKKDSYVSTGSKAKIWDEKKRVIKKMRKSYTQRDIATILGVKKNTVRGWMEKYEIFPKNELFKDLFNQIRVTEKGYKRGIKLLEKLKQNPGEMMARKRRIDERKKKEKKKALDKERRRKKALKSRKKALRGARRTSKQSRAKHT